MLCEKQRHTIYLDIHYCTLYTFTWKTIYYTACFVYKFFLGFFNLLSHVWVRIESLSEGNHRGWMTAPPALSGTTGRCHRLKMKFGRVQKRHLPFTRDTHGSAGWKSCVCCTLLPLSRPGDLLVGYIARQRSLDCFDRTQRRRLSTFLWFQLLFRGDKYVESIYFYWKVHAWTLFRTWSVSKSLCKENLSVVGQKKSIITG